MNRSWNLRQYPTLHQQRRRRQRMTITLAGLALGALMATGTLHVLDTWLQLLRLQHAQLQAQWLDVSQQLKLDQQQIAARDSRLQQAQHLQQIKRQQDAWTDLSGALLGQAQGDAWRLSRLQLEAGQLEWVGWSRDFERLNATRKLFATHLQDHWPAGQAPGELIRQTSVVTRFDHLQGGPMNPIGVEFAWVSPWPALTSSGGAAPKSGAGGKP